MSTLEALKQQNFHFNKQFGQNFLFDGNFLSALVSDAGVNRTADVLEIGAGAGTLTAKLCEKAHRVVAYEIDKNLTELLKDLEKNTPNLTVIIADALKAKIEEIEKNFEGEYHVVANLPYYITSPLIFKFLEETSRVNSISVMVQKEVAMRFAAKPGSGDYGAASVILSHYADLKILRTVKKELFTPPPKVDSAFLQIRIKKEKKVQNVQKFSAFVHGCFAMKRKTLSNNLLAMSLDKNRFLTALETLKISPAARAEELCPETFYELFNILQGK